MAELINSLKTFASYGNGNPNTSIRQHSPSGNQGRDGSLMILGRTDSCNESGFHQWRDAMRMVARLPGGIPAEFRIRLWENLADRYLLEHGIDWSRIGTKCRAETCRDAEIAEQIHKDLHRTGCRGFSGAKQAVLKQVLVSYARWNPAVGYCQGFNMIGAMLLQMTNGDEKLTLKILIYLIEGVLPEGYFSPGLRGLAVDMAVFREILKLRKPSLNAHLSRLQKRDDSPPLTDVFTMHWFLTLFIHCLPTNSVLRIWDLILLEGSEVLLRTSLVLWATIETRVLCVTSTDEFYSVMGVVTRELLEFGLMDPNALVKCIVSIGPFPFPGLQDLRLKHRGLISQDTPHKSFFLAKKELDSLKRHYASIRHRQKNSTTVILKSLNTQMREQRATLAVPIKRQVVSPKPKIRRQISGKHSSASSSKSNGVPATVIRAKQVTVGWDKIGKKPKTFRKRRTSASSHTTSSSSSTELCDSTSENENCSDSAWIPSGNKCSFGDTEAGGESQEATATTCGPDPSVILVPKSSTSSDDCNEEKLLLTLNDSECSSDGSKCIDTNDSQHFLDEMSRLGKSDSFYGNLSQRICELQFQNLRILNTCNTVIDKQELPLRDLDISPMPSPSTPMKPFRSNLEISKLTNLSPNQWSPRGSLSSNGGESPLPRSPLSPSGPNYIGRDESRGSSRSNSNADIPNDGLEEKEYSTSLAYDTSLELKPPSQTQYPKIVLQDVFPGNADAPSAELSYFENETKVDLADTADKMSVNCEINSISSQPHQCSSTDTDMQDSRSKNLHLDLTLQLPLIGFEANREPKDKEFKNHLEFTLTDTVKNEISENSTQPSKLSCKDDKFGNYEGQTEQTNEDINAVIRENIAILQRLKLKPAYGEEEEDFDYFEYDSSDSNDDLESYTNGPDSRPAHMKSSFKANSKSSIPRSSRSSTNSSTSSAHPFKPKTHFNPFPTKRKSQIRTSKFGLYS